MRFQRFFPDSKRCSTGPGQLFLPILLFIIIVVSGTYAVKINGVCQDMYYRPVSGVSIEFHTSYNDSIAYKLTSDNSGRFAIDSVFEKEYMIKILPRDTFPEQWYSPSGNTRFSQYRMWFGPATGIDTLRLKILSNPLNNPSSCTLSVKVVDSSGMQITKVSIEVIREMDRAFVTQVYNDSSAITKITSLQPGGYSLAISSPPYPRQYYDTAGNGSNPKYFIPVAINENKLVTVKLSMKPAGNGYITGKLLDNNLWPLSGMTVSLFRQEDTLTPAYMQSTGTSGIFSFPSIYEGNYFLKISGGNYPAQWYSRTLNKTLVLREDPVWTTPTGTDTMYVNVSMTPSDNRSGSVIKIRVYNPEGSVAKEYGKIALVEMPYYKYTTISIDTVQKLYISPPVKDGSYAMGFEIPGYPRQYYNPSGNTANDSYRFALGKNDTLFFEVTLKRTIVDTTVSASYAYVQSAVSDSMGPVSKAIVRVFEKTGVLLASDTTDLTGKTKTIKVSAQQMYCSVEATGYPIQYWTSGNGRPSATIGTRNYFSIPTMTTMMAEFHLTMRPDTIKDSIVYIDTGYRKSTASITGQVKGASIPISGVKVVMLQAYATQYNFSPQNVMPAVKVFSDTAGNFTIKNPPMGKYLIAAIADSLNYVPQFYQNAELPQNATVLSIDTGSYSGIVFQLRKGGIVKGSIKETAGNPVAGARVSLHENIPNGRYYEATSDLSGLWSISGLSSGSWYISIQHDKYMQSNNSNGNPNITVTEGNTITVDPITMEPGGRFSGTITSAIPIGSTPSNYPRGRIALYPAVNSSVGQFLWYKQSTYIDIISDSTNSGTFRFVSGLCPAGSYKALFIPDPSSWSGDTGTAKGTVYGYSFFNNDTSFDNASTITIRNGDTAGGNILKLRKGFSAFCSVSGNGTAMSNSNTYITTFVKSADKYVQILGSYINPQGVIEIPGLVDNSMFYVKVSSEGYPEQFISLSGTNTTYPKDQIKFVSATGIYKFDIIKNPEGTQSNFNQYISVWSSIDSTGKPVLKWVVSPAAVIDSMVVYTRNKSTVSQRVAVIPYSSGSISYSWTDTRSITNRNDYCIVGKGANATYRSDIISVDMRQNLAPWGSLWLDVSGSRYGIIAEWGVRDTIKFTEKDTAILYRRTPGGAFDIVDRKIGYESVMYDQKWQKSDSLKTFEYQVVIPNRGKSTSIVSFTLNAAFFAELGKGLHVGQGEQYATIQSAIDAAANTDFIFIRNGTYREQLNFKGKNISLNGQWQDNKPAILDALGGTAITIPLITDIFMNGGGAFISGLKITNASTGILSYAQVQVERCLFAGVKNGLIVKADSQAMTTGLKNNPFLNKEIYAGSNNCTFIASGNGSVAFSLAATGPSKSSAIDTKGYDQQILVPLTTIPVYASSYHSLFANYGSSSGLAGFPVSISGAAAHVKIDQSAVWQTSSSASDSSVIFNTPLVSYDPKFKDTLYYMTGDSSTLTTMGIGYSAGYNSGNNRGKGLSAITNLVSYYRAVDKIGLMWNPAPATDSVIRYRIYRVPADPSLFTINADTLWDLASKSDTMMSIFDTFSTTATSFIDNTIVPGKQYMYVVVGVDSSGNESDVRLSGSKPITSFFTSAFSYQISIKADQWNMISPWGVTPATFDSTGRTFIYQWTPDRPKDKLLSYYTSVKSMKPGTGYWFKSIVDTVINVSKESAVNLQPVQDTLRCRLAKNSDGWNMIASPFPHRVNPKLPSNYVIWEWMPDSMGYKRVNMLEPWKGYWIYTAKDTSFLFNSGDNYVASTKALSKRSSVASWELTLSLKSAGGNDPENVIGVYPLQSGIFQEDIPEPPQPFGGSHLYFVKKEVQSDGSEKSVNLSYQYLQPEIGSDKKLEWQVGISSSNSKSLLKVSGIETCPKSTGFYWVCKGTVTDLRQSNSIEIPASQSESYGYVVATSNPYDLTLYSSTFTMRAPFPNPAVGAVSIDYSLPYQWDENGLRKGDKGIDVSIMLFDISGRVIKTIVKEKQLPGKHRAVWNGISQSGRPVGSGVYIVSLRSGDFVKNMQVFRVR